MQCNSREFIENKRTRVKMLESNAESMVKTAQK